MCREIALFLIGLPMRLKYDRASFQALSTASEPPVVKKTRFRSPGREVGQPVGQLDRLRVGVGPEREVGQLGGLLGGGVGELVPAVSGLHHEQAGEAVQVALAVESQMYGPSPRTIIGTGVRRRRPTAG